MTTIVEEIRAQRAAVSQAQAQLNRAADEKVEALLEDGRLRRVSSWALQKLKRAFEAVRC